MAVLWSVIVAAWFVSIYGGHVYMCLGPLNVTEASCRAATGLPPSTDWDRFVNGWAPPAILIVAGWVAIAGIARWKRQRGGL